MKSSSSDENFEGSHAKVGPLELAASRLLYGNYRRKNLETFLRQELPASSSPTNDPEKYFSFSPIPHLHQLESWDCGIACLLMILRWLQSTTIESPSTSQCSSLHTDEELIVRQALHHSIGTESIWTADLIQQLDTMPRRERDEVRYLFCSTTFEVDQNYSEFGYYEAAFGSDEARVAKIFESLRSGPRSEQLVCRPEGLTLEFVLDLVSHEDCVAIVLVDNAVLQQSYLDKNGSTCYVGHYLLLCGVSRDPNHVQAANSLDGRYGTRDGFCLVVCNPGQHQPQYSFLSQSRFERAWRSRGTDEDILFVSRGY